MVTDRKLANCVYVCIADFDNDAVSRAFDSVQQASGIMNVRKARDELHVTLWHMNSSDKERGRACIAADGEKITFAITGFDVSDRISAARVRKLDAKQQSALTVSHDELKMALDVQAPHITLWFARGVHFRPFLCPPPVPPCSMC
jgi:transketolase C-terminal domain/subunit